ncbi:MAG: BACON domain-containing carbohydrate-binding protein [Syntrophorhabdaceae bacterium]|nr:BACON domain-containing carbohydrate-binding protein [Syntrophorhabdaceae bacterium]
MIGPKSAARFFAFLMSLCALVFCSTDIVAAPTCTFSVSPASVTATVHGLPDPTDPRGGGGRPPRVTVTASKAECAWTASTGASWIQLLASGGSGSGYIEYRVAGNKTGTPRTGTIQVAGKTITLGQDSDTVCTVVSISPASVTAPEQGLPEASPDPRAGASSPVPRLTVTTSKGNCPWLASTSSHWIRLIDSRGRGSGYIRYKVMENTSGSPRTGRVEIDRKFITISQGYSGTCTFSVSPASVLVPWQGTDADPRGASSPPSTLSLSCTKASCPWTVKTSANWIKLLNAIGAGSGTVQFRVIANRSGSPRTGTIQVAGKTITVKQQAEAAKGAATATGTTRNACKATISPSSVTVESRGSSGQFKVETRDDCPWTAKTRTPWIGITSGASSKGGGTVQYTVGENKGTKRTGTITAAGKTFRISQKEAPARKSAKTLEGNRKKPVAKHPR